MVISRLKSHAVGSLALSLINQFLGCMSAALGLFLKTTSKWHLILNLSSPEGHRVDDGIPKPPFSVQHVTVDAFIADIMAMARELSEPSFMCWVLTKMWPSILEISHSSEWCGMPLLHGYGSPLWSAVSTRYLYSYCRHSPADGNSQPWGWFPAALLKWFFDLRTASLPSLRQQYAGIHPAVLQAKLEGPSTCLFILGIELHSTTLQAQLPPKKEIEDYCFPG